MPKKTKSKARLDKYYHHAKEQGFRSRAAFKLIQLNKKYSFLENSNVLIDLCAAPGGWLQVAEKYMPLSSVKIGIDLVPIKPVPHVRTFCEDITTPKCYNILKNELKGKKACVVLNDGAPNVGGAWDKDAFSQNELALQAMKLAVKFLRRGGWFITKVFRSADYNSLIWAFNKFFEKVEATKPDASRNTSAEIFVVCSRFIAPEIVDERFFESKYVFKDTEAELIPGYRLEINSVDKLLKKRRRREGYDSDMPQHMHRSLDIEKFLEADNPFPFFLDYSQISITPEQQAKFFAISKPPQDWEAMFTDIQVLGKGEINSLMKWRGKINNILRKKQKKDEDDELNGQSETKVNNEGEEVNSDVELAQEILKERIKEKNKLKKEKEKKLHLVTKIGTPSLNNNYQEEDEELFNIFKHKKLKTLGFIDVEEIEQEEAEEEKRKAALEPKMKRINRKEVEDNIEHIFELKAAKKERETLKKKGKEQEKQIEKGKGTVEFDEEKLKCEPIVTEEPEDKPTFLKKSLQEQKEENKLIKDSLLKKKWFSKKIFEDLKDDLAEGIATTSFKNPLKESDKSEERVKRPASRKPFEDFSDADSDLYLGEGKGDEERGSKKKKYKVMNDDDDWTSDEENKYRLDTGVSEMERRRKALKRSKKRIEKKEQEKSKEDDFEIVPEKTLDDFDVDDLSQTLALAKKMLRKKDREDIIESTYSRYATEDHDELPSWFVEDEKKHNFLNPPISKQDIMAEKERILSLHSRTPKKVMEAKLRKKKKLAAKLKKAQGKADIIQEEEGVREDVKLKKIKNLYKKELESMKTKKNYVVARKFRAGAGGGSMKSGRFKKMVDFRLKKDTRAQKRVEKMGGSKRIKKSRSRHIKRRRR